MTTYDERFDEDRSDIHTKEWVRTQWMIGAVGVTAVLAVLALIVGISALSSSSTPNVPQAAAPAAAGGMAGMGAMNGSAGAAAAAPAAAKTQSVHLTIKSDDEHGRFGPDGKWHDAFLPANFTVHAGATVTVTVTNYDAMPHSFTSSTLSSSSMINQNIPAGSEKAPSTTTFTFTAPTQQGRYLWWCALPCDPFAMTHIGYMRGYVTVAA